MLKRHLLFTDHAAEISKNTVYLKDDSATKEGQHKIQMSSFFRNVSFDTALHKRYQKEPFVEDKIL